MEVVPLLSSSSVQPYNSFNSFIGLFTKRTEGDSDGNRHSPLHIALLRVPHRVLVRESGDYLAQLVRKRGH